MTESFDFDHLYADAQANTNWLVDFRRDIHQHPELGLNTFRTRDKVVEQLKQLGITPSTGWAKGPGMKEGAGLVFDLGTGQQPAVLLRADMDALPILEENSLPFKSLEDGKMHACGHDAHTTMLLGAVKLLKEREADLQGTVRIMFQPGEEGHFGGKYMVEEGVLTNEPAIKHAVALHVVPRTPTGHFATGIGATMAGGGPFTIKVIGKGGHAGVPSSSVDPITTAVAIIQGLQQIVSRESIGSGAKSPFLLSVTQIHGGFTHNVIPSTCTFGGSARAMTLPLVKKLYGRIKEVAEYTAKAHNAEVEVEFEEVVPPLLVDVGVKNILKPLVEKASSVQIKFPESEFVYGMEDFAFVANEVPSVMYGIGIGSGISTNHEIPTNIELHSPHFAVDEAILPRGAAFLAAAANELITSLTKQQRDEL